MFDTELLKILNAEKQALKQELRETRLLVAAMIYLNGGEIVIHEADLFKMLVNAEDFEISRYTDVATGEIHFKVGKKNDQKPI